jgi:Carboxypeptidase regulatory-like domain
MWSLLSGGQRIDPCPPSLEQSPQNIKELRGVVVDENLAVIPKVKVELQAPDGRDFRVVAGVETDATGQFHFGRQRPGKYLIVFTGPRGFCRAAIPLLYSKVGLKGMRLLLPEQSLMPAKLRK